MPPGRDLRTRAGAFRRRLRRRLILHLPEFAWILVAAALALGAGLQLAGNATSDRDASQAADRIYTVDQVRTGLLQDPSSWTERPIQVSGILQGPFVFCGRTNPCPPPTLGLVDDGNGVLGADQYLPVEQDGTSASSPRFNVPAVYRVELHASSDACSLNPDVLCYTGTILTDDPSSH
jgi:hypothetical protein